MSDKKNDPLAVKLSLKKEALRIIDDSELSELDWVIGGVRATGGQDDLCFVTCGVTGGNNGLKPHDD